MRIYLNVPYDEKDKAKQIGAQWDPAAKRWYLWDYKKIPNVSPWLASIDNIYITEHIYIVEASRFCWNCKKSISVFSIGADKFVCNTEHSWKFYPAFYLFNGITKYSDALNKILSIATNNTFKLSYSRTVAKSYLMTNCEYCHRVQGNNFLYDEYDAVFAPHTENEASAFTLHDFPLPQDIGMQGDLFRCFVNGSDSNKLIWENADRKLYKQKNT